MPLTELSAPGEPRIFAAGLMRTNTSLPRGPFGPCTLSDLASNSDAVLVFEERLAQEIDESLTALWEEIPAGDTAFIALVPREAAPRIDAQYSDPISSFLCNSAVFARFADLGINCWARTLCFAVLRAIAEGDIEVDRLLVRQVPLRQPPAYGRKTAPKALVLPHRGGETYLRAALKYIGKSAGNSLTVRVGLDVDDGAPFDAFPAEYPGVEFFHFNPTPVGPYVIRQELAERSSEPLLTLQDSDDLSCYDRFAVLSDALAESGCGIIGSHELCLDEIRALVQPVRYPLDSSGALAICANHALLHATLMSHRDAFFNAGGLSTHLVIANDTQFLLRAYFSTRIRNVDEFLYIRRRHAASLTNSPETIYDNPLRRRLNSEWTGDFNAIKEGGLKMENSSLRPIRRTDPWRVARLAPRPKSDQGDIE